MASTRASQKWAVNPLILKALDNNGIVIRPLSESNIAELTLLVKRNEKVDGFFHMEEPIFSGAKFRGILEAHEDSCLLAFQKTSGKVIGFVVFGVDSEESTLGGITELGVDAEFVFEKKPKNVRNVGSSLLLVACNELLETYPQLVEITTLPSNDKAEQFYIKYGFKPDEDSDEELVFSRKKYLTFEQTVLGRSILLEEKSGLELKLSTSKSTHFAVPSLPVAVDLHSSVSSAPAKKL